MLKPSTPIPRLHFITDTQCQNRFTHLQLATEALEGGAKLIQYRDKAVTSAKSHLQTTHMLQLECARHHATLIVNDRVDVAVSTPNAGVHLGPTDLPINHARKIMDKARLVGATINERAHAETLQAHRPDYVGIGPYRASPNKEAAKIGLGLDGMERLLLETQQVLGTDIPCIAIGGIRVEDVAPLIQIGFHGVAVIGAIAQATSPRDATQAFMTAIHAAVEEH